MPRVDWPPFAMPRCDWPAPATPRADWSPGRAHRRVRFYHSTATLLYFTFLSGFPPGHSTAWSSSSQPAPLEPDLIRDAPLYPPLLDHSLADQGTRDPLQDQETSPNDLITSPHQETKNQGLTLDHDATLEVTPKHLEVINEALVSDNQVISKEELVIKDQKIRIEDLVTLKDQEIRKEEVVNTLDTRAETDDVTHVQIDSERVKRSSGQELEKTKGSRRVKTGDTILNIRGAVRDAIGDAGAAPGPRASSRLDTFVIRPAGDARAAPLDPPRAMPNTAQAPKNERELLVEAHARARIPCDLVNVSHVRWYKDNELMSIPTSWRASDVAWREGDAVVVARATRADAAAWRCAGIDRDGKLVSGKPIQLMIYEGVRALYLAVDGRRLDAGNTWVPVRDKTVLEVRCVAEGGVPPPELSWRLLAVEPSLDHRPYLRIHHTNSSVGASWSHVVVTAARELHNATLQCEARQPRPASTTSTTSTASTSATPSDVMTAKLEIHVTYPPSFVISRWPGFGISLTAGGAAALRCDVDANPPARAWWLRDDAHTSSSPPPPEAGLEPRGSATLRWAALRSTHAGWYRCRATWLDAEYSSIGYYLNVLSPEVEPAPPSEPQENEEPDQQKVEVPLGGNVQLHCPKGSVGCWWRRVVGANSSADSWAPAGSHHAHGVLGIKDALYQEGGEYRCVGARGPDLTRLRELKRVTLRVTGGATATALSASPASGGWRLECGACGRGVRVLWLRGAGSSPPQPASLRPDLAQHCWRAVLHVTEPDEVWCVAVSGSGGAVAVFPARTAPSPAPARHALSAAASPYFTTSLLLAFIAMFTE